MYVDLEVMDRFEELECIISNASSIPFSHKSGIDKEEVLELINNIEDSSTKEKFLKKLIKSFDETEEIKDTIPKI